MYVIFLKIMEFTRHSTGLSLGNLVDVLPGASHNKEGLWGGKGVFGPAPIGTLDKTKIVNIFKNKNKVDVLKVSFEFYIVKD